MNLRFTLAAFFVFTFFSINIFSQSLDVLLSESDSLATEAFDNQKSLQVIEKADSLYPDNWEVQWRLSRSYVDIAEHLPGETDEEKEKQEELYKKALQYAESAVELAPEEAVTYLRRGIANGRIALFKGVFSVGGVVNSVRDDAQKAIELGNGGIYTQSTAHYILGRTHAKISEKWKPARSVLGLGWADIDTAIAEYNKAIEIRPDFRMFYVDLAKALIREDEYDEARAALNKALSTPLLDEDDENLAAKSKELLVEIEDE